MFSLRNQLNIEELRQSQFILIRHAQSTYNQTWEHLIDPMNASDANRKLMELKIATNPELMDSPLSDHGVYQCE
jgi:hypothetical protein